MQKKQFRSKQIQKLRDFAASPQKKKEDRELLHKLLSLKMLQESQSIGLTASMTIEVDTSELIAKLWDIGKDVFLAQTLPQGKMRFVHYLYNSRLKKDEMGIETVADSNDFNDDPDLLLVPGIAFSLGTPHYRLGFGGGYYDRFLASHKLRTISLVNSAMAYAEPQWPVEATDIPIQYLLCVSGKER